MPILLTTRMRNTARIGQVETESEVRRTHQRLDEFSDDTAASLKELRRKIGTIERGPKCPNDNDLGPAVLSSSDNAVVPRAPRHTAERQ
jgi:hypothetical protein